jgi:hypothetical protein
VGSELSLVSGTYHENKVSVVMEMASFSLKIRHVFGDTLLTERSIGAGPPVIIQLSGSVTDTQYDIIMWKEQKSDPLASAACVQFFVLPTL